MIARPKFCSRPTLDPFKRHWRKRLAAIPSLSLFWRRLMNNFPIQENDLANPMLVSGHAASASLDLAQANLICEFSFLPQTIFVLDPAILFTALLFLRNECSVVFILHHGDIESPEQNHSSFQS
jgi:hypothetical protein